MSPELERQLQGGVECMRFRSSPNCSLSGPSCKKVFWVTAGVIFAIAAAFSAMGYWLTLPFAGLEMGVLAWAFGSMNRRRGDYESLEVVGDELLVESRRDGQIEHGRFNRYWAQLIAYRDTRSGHVRLALRSYGRETEIGLFLNDEDRLQLGGSLKAWLGRAG